MGNAIREITGTTTNYKIYNFPNIILNAEEIGFANPDYLNNIAVLEGTCTTYISNITQVGIGVFYSCKNLTRVELSQCTRVMHLGFNACTALASISLPLCVSIGSYAFGGCTKLSSIYAPKCTYIGSNAFAFCSSLNTVNLHLAISVTTLETDAFHNCISLDKIVVPESLYYSFISDSAWSIYSSIIVTEDESMTGGQASEEGSTGF